MRLQAARFIEHGNDDAEARWQHDGQAFLSEVSRILCLPRHKEHRPEIPHSL
jgi:hypothetical protein